MVADGLALPPHSVAGAPDRHEPDGVLIDDVLSGSDLSPPSGNLLEETVL